MPNYPAVEKGLGGLLPSAASQKSVEGSSQTDSKQSHLMSADRSPDFLPKSINSSSCADSQTVWSSRSSRDVWRMLLAPSQDRILQILGPMRLKSSQYQSRVSIPLHHSLPYSCKCPRSLQKYVSRRTEFPFWVRRPKLPRLAAGIVECELADLEVGWIWARSRRQWDVASSKHDDTRQSEAQLLELLGIRLYAWTFSRGLYFYGRPWHQLKTPVWLHC